MPQALHYMEVTKGLKKATDACIDWGTLVIYTCSKDCDIQVKHDGSDACAYAEEFVWKQQMNH